MCDRHRSSPFPIFHPSATKAVFSLHPRIHTRSSACRHQLHWRAISLDFFLWSALQNTHIATIKNSTIYIYRRDPVTAFYYYFFLIKRAVHPHTIRVREKKNNTTATTTQPCYYCSVEFQKKKKKNCIYKVYIYN